MRNIRVDMRKGDGSAALEFQIARDQAASLALAGRRLEDSLLRFRELEARETSVEAHDRLLGMGACRDC